VWNSKRLILAHLWFAFAGFGPALLLGEWQMLVRSPLHAWISDPEWYYRSVTAHGTTMANVLPTLVAMGFGYFVADQGCSGRWSGCAGLGSGWHLSSSVRSPRLSRSRWDMPQCFTPSTRR
jgi:cytochrome c oxidase subunit I